MSTLDIESLLLRVYCVVNDKAGNQALHESIIQAARAGGLAGASVLRAKMGFGRGGFLYSDLLSEVFCDHQPVVVEIVDQPDRIQAFLPTLHNLVRGRRLITMEQAEVILYRPQDNAIQ
jgi:PII-like signaling protein